MLNLTAKITKEPRVFEANGYTGFNMLLGKQYYCRQTKQKAWTNYKAVVFAKDKQAQFYRETLKFGAIVELYSEDIKVDMYKPEYPNIELLNAQLIQVFSNNDTPNQAQSNSNQQSPAPVPPQDDMDDDIPF